MGFDNDCILNIQSLAGEYFCPVCHLLVYPNEALQAPCTHLYCKPCLTYVVSTTHACPYDGYRVTEADCKPLLESNKALADTIGKIQVHCLYYRTGCTWQGALSDCTSHCATCSFGESPVLCNRCSVQIVHRQVQEHAQNCPGVQSQAQQTSTVQDTTSTVAGTAAEQNKVATQTGISASQANTSQTSAPLVSGQDANSAAQPQAAQAAVPTQEQWQQYQQQYQQYYQQYPGYDPYQQNYPYYYQYQQGAQQYAQQQPMQGYPPQPYGQTQPQAYAQAPVQPQLQAQQVQVQAPTQTAQPQSTASAPPQAPGQGQAQPQIPAQGLAQSQMQAQAQPQMLAQGQAQPQIPAQGLAQPQVQAQAQPQMLGPGQTPSSQALPYNQSQSYVQQPKYQQTPQMQYPHSQPYPQSQTTQTYPYPHPQSQVQSQPQSQPTLQAPPYPPSQQNQPMNPGAQLPTQNAVSGYQSYPQAQPHPQGQGGAPHPMHVSGAQPQAQYPPQYPAQMQGKVPAQPSQYPPQPYANIPSQQFPPVSSAQGQPPSGPPPAFSHPQQPGYPIQHRPGLPAAQQAPPPQQYAQPQSFTGQGPYMHPQPPMGPNSHAQGPPQLMQQSQQNYAPGHGGQQNMAQSYAARPVAQGGASQLYPPAPPHAGAGHVRPSQLNQTGHLQQTEKPHDQVVDKSMHDQNNINKAVKSAIDSGFNGNESKVPAMGSKPLESDAIEGVSEPPPGNKLAKNGAEDNKDVRMKAESQESKQTVKSGGPNMPQSNLITQVHGANPYGPSAQLRPGAVPMSPSTSHPFNSQQSTLGQPPRPGQAPSRPPFHSAENSHPSSGPVLTPGSSGSFPRPGNMSYHQGITPPYQGGQPQNPPSDSFGGSSFAAERTGAFDSHVGGRERANFEQHPRYPMDNEKFPVQRPGYFDGRNPESLPHGSLDRAPYGPGPVQPGAKISGSHDSISGIGMRDERGKSFPEEHMKHFPHREFEDDPRKFPRQLGTQFPSSGPLDHRPHVFAGDGPSRPFDKAPHGFDRDPGFKMDSGPDSGPSRFLPPFHPNDVGERGRPSGFSDDIMGRGHPGPGFGRSRMDGLPPRSPGRDFPPRTIGAFGDGGNSFPAEPFGKSINDSRFPVPPNHLQRGEIDVPGNMRVGGPRNQDMLPSHLQRDPLGPRNMHPRMGEPPLAGKFPQHLPFGGEKPGHPLAGEPGFRGGSDFQHFGREGGFYHDEMERFDDPRKWKPVGIMCRICKVECGTVEGLDLHSQSREHQRNAREMVLSIKQQNKKQKISKDQASFEGRGRGRGRSRNSNFQGRGNKF